MLGRCSCWLEKNRHSEREGSERKGFGNLAIFIEKLGLASRQQTFLLGIEGRSLNLRYRYGGGEGENLDIF